MTDGRNFCFQPRRTIMILTRKFRIVVGVITVFFTLLASKGCIELLAATKKTNIEYLQNDTIPYDEIVDLRIIVLTVNRPKSLHRLLKSLDRALYMNDTIAINIWIDRLIEGNYDLETYNIARSFRFHHGKKYINIHSTHVGIFGQWIYTWNINDNSSEIAVILEDDIEVSSFFYRWLKLVHTKYDGYRNINGYSLHGTCENHDLSAPKKQYVEVPKNNSVYLYPAFNTWGFSPNKKHWIHFVNWASSELKNKSFKPFVPGIAPTLWYMQALSKGTELTNWDMWHLYHAYKNQLFTLFPNIPGDIGLSIHWKEKGLHYGENANKAPSGELLLKWVSELEELPEHPIYLDYAGRQMNYIDI